MMPRYVTIVGQDPDGFTEVCKLVKETYRYYHVSIVREGYEVSMDVLRLKRDRRAHRIIEGEHFELIRRIKEAVAKHKERIRQWDKEQTDVMIAAKNKWEKRHPRPELQIDQVIEDYLDKNPQG